MATLELNTLADYLEDDELEAIRRALNETGTAPLDIDETAEPMVLDRDLDDDILVDFVDRLEANDAGADIYLPSDFEDVLDVGEHRYGSAHALLLVLENLREDFHIPDDDGEEADDLSDEDFEPLDDDDEGMAFDDDESGSEMKDDQLRHIWKTMYRGARGAIQRGLCLIVKS